MNASAVAPLFGSVCLGEHGSRWTPRHACAFEEDRERSQWIQKGPDSKPARTHAVDEFLGEADGSSTCGCYPLDAQSGGGKLLGELVRRVAVPHFVPPRAGAARKNRIPISFGHVDDEQTTGPKRSRKRVDGLIVMLDLLEAFDCYHHVVEGGPKRLADVMLAELEVREPDSLGSRSASVQHLLARVDPENVPGRPREGDRLRKEPLPAARIQNTERLAAQGFETSQDELKPESSRRLQIAGPSARNRPKGVQRPMSRTHSPIVGHR
jgi:hypothetical protein